tara:strand:- start:373 stop:1230 length:858 start_codon:yes stop_codon:yes gene_type:complete
MNKKRLGKGLEALIPSYVTDDALVNGYLSIDSIIPNNNQPRQFFDRDSLDSLVISIKEKGIIQPLAVREISNGKYELIAGERRLRAAKKAGLDEVPVYLLSVDADTEMMEYALIENVQRVDLNPIEEAEAYAILSGKYGLSQAQIGSNIGKSRSAITNSLRLLKLPNKIKNSLKSSEISSGHARSILSLKSRKEMLLLFNKIIKEKISVRESELYVKRISAKLNHNQGRAIINKKGSDCSKFEKNLSIYLDSKVMVRKHMGGKGNIKIEFESISDLERVTKLITK